MQPANGVFGLDVDERVIEFRPVGKVRQTRKAEPISGSIITMYDVVDVNRVVGWQPVVASFASMSGALDAVRRLTGEHPDGLFEVSGRLERDGGSLLHRGGVVTVSWTHTATVTIAKFAPIDPDGPIVGWLFFGVASS